MITDLKDSIFFDKSGLEKSANVGRWLKEFSNPFKALLISVISGTLKYP